ncbi:MAG: hypothetical protein KJ791_00700, partial [Nanoarchaeota archaeon]|nr:hypothetical protein [Nanoarchaeota archaeon]
NKSQIEYNEKDNHCTLNSVRRGVSFNEVETNLLNPENLKFATKEKQKFRNEEKYVLYFESKDSDKTIVLPVIFKPKSLYVLTIIKRWRSWDKEIERWKEKLQK